MKKLSQSGFSLIELMIVVAIIGILASVAIPNYQSFQRKSRQAEAKALLGGYYAASMASSAELNGHVGNFVGIGFKPAGQLTYRITALNNTLYTLAYMTANYNNAPSSTGCVVTSANAGACITNSGTASGYGNGVAGAWQEKPAGSANVVGPVAAATCVPLNNNASGNGSTFTTCASARIGGGLADEWSIMSTKAMANVVSGI